MARRMTCADRLPERGDRVETVTRLPCLVDGVFTRTTGEHGSERSFSYLYVIRDGTTSKRQIWYSDFPRINYISRADGGPVEVEEEYG